MSHNVFISYASKDAEVANAVCKALEAEDIRCWIAPRDILPGEEYADAIIGALNSCQLFLVILSEESNSSPQVRREVERAVSKNLSILTFRIDNTILSKAMEYYLSNRHWLDASNAVFSKQLHSLSEAVHKLLEQFPAPKEETGIPESVEINEPVPPVLPTAEVTPASVPPPISVKIHKKAGRIWLLAPFLLIIFAAAAYFGLAGKYNLPLFTKATVTSTSRPISSVNYAATGQLSKATVTTMGKDAWIAEFAEPILSQIASRSPDFKDDFSNPAWSNSHWDLLPGVTVENGQAVIRTTDQWQGLNITSSSSDFVFMFEFTPTASTLLPLTLSLGISFRENTDGQIYNHFSTGSDDWCGFGEDGPASHNRILAECHFLAPIVGETTKIAILVQGDKAAAYINDQPVLYTTDIQSAGNDLSLGATVADGTASIAIDNVELWYLK